MNLCGFDARNLLVYEKKKNMFEIVLAFTIKSSYFVTYYVFKNVSRVLNHPILMLISKFCNMKTCRIMFLNIINSTSFPMFVSV